MHVRVERPRIDGETVHFAWSQDAENPFQVRNAFSLRYEGIDLCQFSSPLFIEVFLSLQLRVFAAFGQAVT